MMTLDTTYNTKTLPQERALAQTAMRDSAPDDCALRSPQGINIDKYCVDIYTTNGKVLPQAARNTSAYVVNLLGKLAQSTEAVWRNPIRARVKNWSRREVMHIFNGVFHQSITDYETYETFGKCYTCPDPFRNDDPPWESCFCP